MWRFIYLICLLLSGINSFHTGEHTDFTVSCKNRKDSSCKTGNLNYTKVPKLLKDLFSNYPDYRTDFINYGEDKGIDTRVYEGMIKIMKRDGGFDIILTDAEQQGFQNNVYISGAQHTTQLYRCTRGVQFCNGNPRYCQYQEGDINTNVIITVPHGGGLKPKQMRDLTGGYYINGKCEYNHDFGKKGLRPDTEHCPVPILKDDYSRVLSILLADDIKEITGSRPHVVMMDLTRAKIDVNRKIDEGTFGDPEAMQAYEDFHKFIVEAKSRIKGRGMLFDIHGQGHSHYLVELGYHIEAEDMNKGKLSPSDSSINALAHHVKIPFPSLFNGNASLGFFLERENIGTLPSPRKEHRKPGNREYFNGKHITAFYGSEKKGILDAIQIEIPKIYRHKDTHTNFTKKLSKAIINFMELNYVHKGIAPDHNWLK